MVLKTKLSSFKLTLTKQNVQFNRDEGKLVIHLVVDGEVLHRAKGILMKCKSHQKG